MGNEGDWTLAITGERTSRRRCLICRNLYAYNPEVQVSCAVRHPPGQCCHYGETLVPEEPIEIQINLTEPLPGGKLTANDSTSG